MSTLGERLKFLRDGELRISQREFRDDLADLGVHVGSHTTVGRYERDQEVPGADYLRAVLDLVKRRRGKDYAADWLLLGRGEPLMESPAEAQERLRLVRVAVDAEDISALVRLLGRLDGGG